MGRIRYKNSTPPRGWVYIQPETRLRIDGENYDTLIRRVLEHRTYKGLPRATKEEVQIDVERQLCSRLSKNECFSEGANDELRPVEENATLTLSSVTRFTAAAIRWLSKGANIVPMEQMKRRQKTCLECPLNNPLKACSCSVFYKTINALVPPERRDPGLFICSACGCSTVAKTQMPIEMVLQADEGRDIKYPIHCWVTQETPPK